MKKFISEILKFSIVLFVGFTILWLFLYVNPMNYSSYSYSITNNIKKYMKNSLKKEAIIIGDSRALAGITPTVFNSGDSYNLSIAGGTPIEGYFTVKKIIKYAKKPEYIILSYAPFHLINHNTYPRPIAEDLLDYKDITELYEDLNNDSEIFWDNKQLSFSEIKDLNLLKAYLYKLKFPLYFKAEMRNSMFNRSSSNLKIKESVEKSMGTFSFGQKEYCDELNRESSLSSFSPNEVIIKNLKKLLDLAEKNNIQVIYYNMPFNESSYISLPLKFRSEYNSFFKKFKKLYPKVVFLSQIKYYENSFFGDSSHLNISGQLKLSIELNETLKKIKAQTYNNGKSYTSP